VILAASGTFFFDLDVFLLALERAGISPSEGLAVGDSVWDIEAAGHAGLSSIGVESGGTDGRALREAGAAVVYRNCAGVLDHLTATPVGGLSNGSGPPTTTTGR
jgi:phosphoglycolate phosphatase-like HAD superfamily hydrolase